MTLSGGNIRRAIDFHEGEKINEEALKAVIRAAVSLNQSRKACGTLALPGSPPGVRHRRIRM